MKLSNFQKTNNSSHTQISMTVKWEDSNRTNKEIFIETVNEFGQDLNPNPNSFLLAAVMYAMEHKEKRILVEGAICPELRNGLQTVMPIFNMWYPNKKLQPLTIEASEGFKPAAPPNQPRVASFLSGGLDALTTLRTNHLDHPVNSYGRIQDCFFVHGLDVGGYVEMDDNQENSNTAITSLTKFAAGQNIRLIPLRTNIRHIDDNDWIFFSTAYGSNLAALAHAFSSKLSKTLIASGSGLNDLGPIGSHPLIDGNYSTAALGIYHDGLRYSRLEKAGVLAEWPEGLSTLRACYDAFRPASNLNCGSCEKCIRTMTELLVYGKLDQCPTYPHNNITPEIIDSIDIRSKATINDSREVQLSNVYKSLNQANNYYWKEMIEPLRSIGRKDLANVIQNKITLYDRMMARKQEQGIFGKIKKFDRKFLGSKLLRLKQLSAR